MNPQKAQISPAPGPDMDPTQSNKLTDWKNEPSVASLKSDLEMAKPSHDALVRNMDRWAELMAVTGSARPKKVKGRSQVQPKLIRRQAEWRYSALSEPFLGSEKMFKVEPATFEDVQAARQNEMLLNYQFRTKLNRVKLIDDYVRCTVDEGSCVLRTGWERVTTTVEEEVPVFNFHEMTSQEELDLFKKALETRQLDPRTFAEQAPPELVAALEYYDDEGIATVAAQNGTEKVKVEKPVENRPTVDVLNPRNVFIDPSCQGDIDKALFVIVSFETSQAELKKNPKRYKNLDRVNWETSTPITENDHTSSNNQDVNGTNFQDNLRKRVIAYEYWGFYDVDGNGTLKPFVATWIGSTMIRMEENPFPDEKLPFVVVSYLPIKRELFGEPDAELLEDNQKILGAVTRGMIDLMGRSANSQQGFAKGMLDPLNRRRYEQGQDYEFNPNIPVQNGLIEHKYPEIPGSAITMVELQNQEAEALTGVKSFSGGISGQAYGDVAAGIRGVLDAASKREMAILRRLAKGIVDVGVKFTAMNSIFLSEKEVVRVTNEEFVEIKREDLKGNFDLKVDISTAEIDDMKVKDIGFILQTVGPDLEPQMKMMMLAEMAELKRMPKLANDFRNWKPTPDPLVEELKQLQVESEKMKILELQSKIRLNEAKAAETLASKDQKDLDFVEQETGTKHERDMERQQGQAEGNKELEITKALVRPRKEGESEPDVEAAIGYDQLSEVLDGKSPSELLEQGAPPAPTIAAREDMVDEGDPRYSIGSRFFDPQADPATNQSLNFR